MKYKTSKSIAIYVILFVSCVIEVILAYTQPGFSKDLEFIYSWGVRLHRYGFADFYSSEVMMPYPPGYLYVIYAVQCFVSLFCMNDLALIYCIYRFPPIICDLITGWIIYKLSASYGKLDDRKATIVSALYLFNPAVMINSAVWGQVDSCFTLGILVMCILLMKRNNLGACITFGLSIIVKQQAIAFAPVLFWGMIDISLTKKNGWKEFGRCVIQAGVAFIIVISLCVPFGLKNVYEQYFSTLSVFPCMSVNAYNLWTFLGLNGVRYRSDMWVINRPLWGKILVVLTYLMIMFYGWKGKKKNGRYMKMAAMIITSIFTFAVGMHERYMFAGMALLLGGFVISHDIEMLVFYIIISLLDFANVYDVLYMRSSVPYANDYWAKLISLVCIITVIVMWIYIITPIVKTEKNENDKKR